MIGSIIGAGVGLASSIFGGVKSAKANRRRKRELAKQKRENENLFNSQYYQDYTQRSDVQNLLGTYRDRFKEQNAAAANTAAVMGGTPEAAVAAQKANNEAYGSVVGQVAANADNYKDNVLNRYQQQKSALDGRQSDLDQESSQNWSNFISNAGNTMGSAIGSISSGIGNNRGNNNLNYDSSKGINVSSKAAGITNNNNNNNAGDYGLVGGKIAKKF